MKPVRILASTVLLLGVFWACTQTLKGPDGQPTTEQDVVAEGNALMTSWKSQIAALEARPTLSPVDQGNLAKLKAQLANAEADMSLATTPGGGIDAGAAATSIGMLLPPPWNIPVAVLGGGVVEWFRSRKKRKSFERLVDAINKAKKKTPAFATAIDTVGPDLRLSMGETAAAEVDRVRNGGRSLIRDW